MKTCARSKSRPARARRAARPAARRHPAGPVADQRNEEIKMETFTPMETGSPEDDKGYGPLGQEGEGEAQNDQLAALEGVPPKLKKRDL
jgi:hypothetical protein